MRRWHDIKIMCTVFDILTTKALDNKTENTKQKLEKNRNDTKTITKNESR